MSRRRLSHGLLCLSLAVGAIACRNPSALEKAAANVARAQGVDESAVRLALREFATTEDDQLRLARTWANELPVAELPSLSTWSQRLGDAAARELRSAACGAVADILRTGQIPNARAFMDGYLTGLALSPIPEAELLGVAEDFEDLYDEAVAGQLTYVDVRLTIMKFQYC